MDIRRIENQQLDEAIKFVQDVILHEKDASWSQQAAKSISDFMAERLRKFTVYGLYTTSLQSVIAYEEEKMHIILLLTKLDSRRQGYASALLNHVQQLANDNHFAKLTANVVNSAKDFYHNYGFGDTGESTQAGRMEFTPMEFLLGQQWLGKTVHIHVDHEYGSFHPHIADMTYPVNAGYVEEIFQQTGEFQDAYIVGVQEPLETFTGVVSGIIYHQEDSSAYFIVSRVGAKIDHDEVIQAVGFEQQFYRTRIVWKTA